VVISVLYLLVRRLLALLRRFDEDCVAVENAVLRHQLTVLRRQVGQPRYRPSDQLFLVAASRIEALLGSKGTGCPHSACSSDPNGRPDG
jgi:hypothetical protein